MVQAGKRRKSRREQLFKPVVGTGRQLSGREDLESFCQIGRHDGERGGRYGSESRGRDAALLCCSAPPPVWLSLAVSPRGAPGFLYKGTGKGHWPGLGDRPPRGAYLQLS